MDDDLLRLRHEALGRGKLKNIIVTGSGRLRVADYRVFRSEHVDAFIATTPDGLRNLGDLSTAKGKVPVLVSGQGRSVNWLDLLRELRTRHDVRYLLCEGGPTVYGDMLRAGCIDEKFLTIAPQEIGAGFPDSKNPLEPTAGPSVATDTSRPTSFAGSGFTPETARWYRWLSSRRAGDHEFNRYRALPVGTVPLTP